MQRVGGELPRDSQQAVQECAGKSCTTSIRRPMRCPSRRWKRSISTCCGRPGRWSRDVRKWYDEFAFHKIYHRVNHFCVVDLSAFYFDVIKDRLYTYAPNSAGRRSAQTAVWRICEAMTRLLAPILSFTCEEVWQHLPKMADPSGQRASGEISGRRGRAGQRFGVRKMIRKQQDWTTLLAVREQVLKALEEARNSKMIGKSLEAQLVITAADPAYSVLQRYAERSAVFVHRVGGYAGAGFGQREQRRTCRGEEGRRSQVRALLEFLHACRRGQDLSDGLRALQRRAEGAGVGD